MTIADFDLKNIENYTSPKYLLHVQWGDGGEIYRYALVEKFSASDINHRSKQKTDEKNLTQKEIWEKKYAKNYTCTD